MVGVLASLMAARKFCPETRHLPLPKPCTGAYAPAVTLPLGQTMARNEFQKERPNPMPQFPASSLPAIAPGRGFDLIAGTRVLDLTGSVAGPYAPMLLADMGAEVLNVERPGTGDDSRAWGPPFLDGESLWFLSVNRNKQSLALDYTKPEGRAVLMDLVQCADVMVVNVLPRAAAKLGIDAKSLQAIKPDLIYVSITGFGMEGERADWACYDLIAEGYSGVMDLTGEIDSAPQKVGTPAADMLAGQDAAFATLAAAHRQRPRRQGPRYRHRAGRFHDTVSFLPHCALSRFGRSAEAFGRQRQRDRHLPILRHGR